MFFFFSFHVDVCKSFELVVFIVSPGSLGHITSSFGNYFNSRVAIHEKIGFEIGIFPLFGLCHCGLATDVSGVL